MTRRQRTTLFAIGVLIFFVASPSIILYTAGYRIDFAAREIVKTGGLSMTASPSPADVFLDGKLVSSSNFLFRNIFISNLLPRNYSIEVAKDGYYSWQKKLEVEEGQVAEALDITLYPKNPQSIMIAPNVTSLFASPDGSHNLFTQSGNKGETLFLGQQQSDPAAIKILAKGEVIQQVFWAQDNNSFLLLEKINGTVRLLLGSTLHELSAPQDLSTIIPAAVLSHLVVVSIQFSQDGKLAYLLSAPTPSKGGIYILHLDTHLFEGPVQGNISGFLSTQDGVYIMSVTTGFLSKCSADLTSCTQISSDQLDKGGIGFATLATDGDHLTFLQDTKLYLFQPDQQTFAYLTDGVRAVFFSPDKQKMAIQKDHEISVYWFKDIARGEKHTRGDTNLLLRISEKITGVAWLGSPYAYLAVEADDALRIAELDGRDTRNIISYPAFSSLQSIFWQKNTADIILVHGQALLRAFIEKQAQ